MKKLFALLALTGLFLTACDDGNGGEKEGAVTIDASDKNKTIGADDMQATVSFETDGSWTASLHQITRATDTGKAPDWAEIQGSSSGEAGSHTLTIKIDANPGEATRSFGVSIKCGKTTLGAMITQAGTGGTEEPGAKKIISIKSVYSGGNDGGGWTSMINFTYDSQGRIASMNKYDPDTEQESDGESLAFSYETGKVTISSSDNYQYVVELNGDGYAETVSCKGDDDKVTLTYLNGYLIKTEASSQSYSDYHFKWSGGNMVKCWLGGTEPADHETSGFDRYAYSDHANSKANLDLNMLCYGINYIDSWAQGNGILTVIGLAGYTGKRSAKLTTSYYYINMKTGSFNPEDPYYYSPELTKVPNVYTFDSEGYVTKITTEYTIDTYQILKSSGDRTLKKSESYSDVSEITYNN